MEIPLPPLTEQRRIVERIEALAGRVDEAQSLRREAIEEAEDLDRMLLSTFLRMSKGVTTNLPMEDVAPINQERPIHIDSSTDYHELGIRSFGIDTIP